MSTIVYFSPGTGDAHLPFVPMNTVLYIGRTQGRHRSVVNEERLLNQIRSKLPGHHQMVKLPAIPLSSACGHCAPSWSVSSCFPPKQCPPGRLLPGYRLHVLIDPPFDSINTTCKAGVGGCASIRCVVVSNSIMMSPVPQNVLPSLWTPTPFPTSALCSRSTGSPRWCAVQCDILATGGKNGE